MSVDILKHDHQVGFSNRWQRLFRMKYMGLKHKMSNRLECTLCRIRLVKSQHHNLRIFLLDQSLNSEDTSTCLRYITLLHYNTTNFPKVQLYHLLNLKYNKRFLISQIMRQVKFFYNSYYPIKQDLIVMQMLDQPKLLDCNKNQYPKHLQLHLQNNLVLIHWHF